MKTKRFQRVWVIALCVLLLTMLLPVTASADVGPKPSIRITFENVGDAPCYATLLSEDAHNGPWFAWSEGRAAYGENADAWRAFAKYEDKDGYYFLQESWCISEDNRLEWTYYPPSPFKILLYYPETDSYAASSSYGTYALHSHYVVDLADIDPASLEYGEEAVFARHSYRHGSELAALLLRILLTIGIELLIALPFGLREKKQFGLLIAVNLATQLLLNLLLNIFEFKAGLQAFILGYIFLEVAVFLIEAAAYCKWMPKRSAAPRKKQVYVLYALIANAVSFYGGMAISVWIPALFS